MGIHPKETHRATRVDVAATMSLCKSKGWAVGKLVLDYSDKEHHLSRSSFLRNFSAQRIHPLIWCCT